jgi:hypothetical protein
MFSVAMGQSSFHGAHLFELGPKISVNCQSTLFTLDKVGSHVGSGVKLLSNCKFRARAQSIMVHARRYEPMTTSDFSGPLPNCGPLSNGSAVNGPWTEVWGSSNGRILQSCVNMQPQKYSLWQLWAGPGRVAYPAVGKKWFQKKI